MRVVFTVYLLHSILQASIVDGQTYDQTKSIIDTLLDSSKYDVDVRPLIDQSQPIYIKVNFQLVSIVDVDDVTQSFICNGFLGMSWKDEKLTWDRNSYGGVIKIYPHPKRIWRPRLVLLNTLTERDLFEDDACPTSVESSGSALWAPGGLFTTKCDLDMTHYPFDKQTCTIKMIPMISEVSKLQFIEGNAGYNLYTGNGQWTLLEINIKASNQSDGGIFFSSFEVTFEIERRPTFAILNVILPVVLLSLLNMLVFTIPAESGEKVGYGITVVLAIAVFLGVVSGMLPRSSDNVPNVIIYLFILLAVSVLTVIDAIIIVYLHNKEEKEPSGNKIKPQHPEATKRIIGLQQGTNMRYVQKDQAYRSAAVISSSWKGRLPQRYGLRHDPLPSRHQTTRYISGDLAAHPEQPMNDRNDEDTVDSTKYRPNKYKAISKYIDSASLVVFICIWLGVNLWFFISVRVIR